VRLACGGAEATVSALPQQQLRAAPGGCRPRRVASARALVAAPRAQYM
jgi:hypothetical protein